MTETDKDPVAGKSRAFKAAIEAVEEMGRAAAGKKPCPPAPKKPRKKAASGSGAKAGKGKTAEKPSSTPPKRKAASRRRAKA